MRTESSPPSASRRAVNMLPSASRSCCSVSIVDPSTFTDSIMGVSVDEAMGGRVQRRVELLRAAHAEKVKSALQVERRSHALELDSHGLQRERDFRLHARYQRPGPHE